MIWRPLLAGLAAVAALLGCGASSEEQAGVDAAPPPGADIVFEREGLPGPWWRRGATGETFDTEVRACLVRSREARRGTEDPADAAYRGFLECMQQTGWVRGLPPKRPAAQG